MKPLILIATGLPVLALVVTSLTSLPTKLIYNSSESAPIGLYWIDDRPAERGDYVLVRVPDRVRNLVVERGYLPPDVPIIKRIAGGPGDEICRIGLEVRVNGVTIAMAQIVDGSGREMPVWSGCHVLHGRRVFLLQDHPASFDSRYFGPVDRSLIVGRATYLRPRLRKREQS